VNFTSHNASRPPPPPNIYIVITLYFDTFWSLTCDLI